MSGWQTYLGVTLKAPATMPFLPTDNFDHLLKPEATAEPVKKYSPPPKKLAPKKTAVPWTKPKRTRPGRAEESVHNAYDDDDM